jgi:hypothetical protein
MRTTQRYRVPSTQFWLCTVEVFFLELIIGTWIQKVLQEVLQYWFFAIHVGGLVSWLYTMYNRLCLHLSC